MNTICVAFCWFFLQDTIARWKEGVEVDHADDRDMTAALTLIEMADEHGNIQVDGKTADAIRAAEWLPSSNDNKPFTKLGRDTSSVNVSFEKYSEVYGSRVIILLCHSCSQMPKTTKFNCIIMFAFN